MDFRFWWEDNQDRLALLSISFLTLFFELLFIRWLPTEIRILAYFSNITLISCVLGLGLGSLTAHDSQPRPHRFLLLLCLAILMVHAYYGRDLTLPLATDSHFIWNGLSRQAIGTIWQYGAMFVFLALNVAVFVPLGQMLGRHFDRLPPVEAYSVNVVGALIGIGGFALLSVMHVSPFWWFALGLGLLLPFLERRWFSWVLTGTVLLLASIGNLEPGTIWSPYYKITAHPFWLGKEFVGFEIRVNEDSHQQALDLSGRWDGVADLTTRRLIYDEPYRYGYNQEVLIVGAGTGNDVAAALRAGAGRVDAVEIDPAILSLGGAHPERPYQDSRVTAVNRDARSFLQSSDRTYDKIILGYLDSHSLFSAMSSLRLDNFVYTREFFREMKEHLNPGGVLAVTFTVHERWIADRLYTLFNETFGSPPLVFQGAMSSSRGTVFLGGTPTESVQPDYLAFNPRASKSGTTWKYAHTNDGYISPTAFRTDVTVPTDDWPYLYLRDRAMPLNYWVPLGCLLFLALGWVKVRARSLGRIRWHFFLLGAGFLLVETKAITELAVFLGSTWVSNAFVIGTILGLILLANLASGMRWCPSTNVSFGVLGLILFATFLLPVSALLHFDSEARNWIAVTVLCLPLFFAGIIFARELRKEERPSSALGSNLMGALVGGVLEYGSMSFGFSALYLFAGVLYAGAWLLFTRPRILMS